MAANRRTGVVLDAAGHAATLDVLICSASSFATSSRMSRATSPIKNRSAPSESSTAERYARRIGVGPEASGHRDLVRW